MSATPPEPDLSTSPARREYYRAAMQELVGMALDVTRIAHQQVLAEAAPPPPADTAPALDPALDAAPQPHSPKPDTILRFDRAARCLRQSIAVADRLERPLALPRNPLDLAPDRTTARKRIIRAIEDRIVEAGIEPGDAQPIHIELIDRLDDPDIDDGLLVRPIPEIVTEFCRDLGLIPDYQRRTYKRRTPYDVAILHALASRAPVSAALALVDEEREHQRPQK